MNINIITLGRLKEEYFKQLSAEYEKRLSAYCKLNIVEITPVKTDNALEKEAVLIKQKTPQKSYKIALCYEGKRFSSEAFAEKLLKIENHDISFIIGSSEGLSREIKESADMKLSLSDMTFPHRLARIMLLEQLYRAFSIHGNKKYHK